MASAQFDTVIGGGSATFAEGSGLTYGSAGSNGFLASYSVGNQQRDIRAKYQPGLNGGGTKDFGLREQKIRMTVIYVNASEDGCLNAAETDDAVISNVCVLSLAGRTYTAVVCKGFTKPQPKSTAYGTYRMECELELLAVGE